MELDQLDTQAKRVLSGDRDAFTEIVRLTQDRLRAFILFLCPWKDEVDDVAQEVYIYAYRHLDQYTPGTDLFAWLRALARNRALTHARSSSARARREQRYADARLTEAAAESSPADPETDRISALRDCIDRLPQNVRKMIQKRYQSTEDMETLARAFGKSASALRVALLRTRQRLRECIESKLVGESA